MDAGANHNESLMHFYWIENLVLVNENFRMSNEIPKRIIFVSRDIVVHGYFGPQIWSLLRKEEKERPTEFILKFSLISAKL